jgi:hypothetical protein
MDEIWKSSMLTNPGITPAFAALTHATDRTIEEMKVVLRI